MHRHINKYAAHWPSLLAFADSRWYVSNHKTRIAAVCGARFAPTCSIMAVYSSLTTNYS